MRLPDLFMQGSRVRFSEGPLFRLLQKSYISSPFVGMIPTTYILLALISAIAIDHFVAHLSCYASL